MGELDDDEARQSDHRRRAQIALVGRLQRAGPFLWSRKVPVTVLATEDEVCFIPYDGSRVAKSFLYDALHSVSSRDFLGRKTLILHGISGVEAVRCSASQDELLDFCRFVNSRIAATEKKPVGARFKLTQLEAPPDARFTPEHPQEEYDSAIDALFDPIDWTEVLFDDLDKSVEIDRQSFADERPTQQNTPSPHSRPRRDPPKRRRPRQANGFSRIVVEEPRRRTTKRSWVVGTLAVLLLSGTLWWRSGSSSVETKAVEPLEIAELPIQSVESGPEGQPTDFNSRVAARLLQIMQDEREYAQLMDIFRKHRQARGLTPDQVSAALGWRQAELNELELGIKRPKLIGLIDFALAIDLDIHDAVGKIK
ncbi:helix-turn-helix domain-containing protein [Pseudaminobacter sp. NGMCC 1.201702]|uniref:helix-turn-helix domain-containing protein n=1 Tax=Pseudaminobacter sp. NGMCC 1.201702 TaxID=3391825 RepID=UPI0039F0EECB